MTASRRSFVIAASSWLVGAAAHAKQLEAPNVVVIGPRLTTSGQPGAQALSGLRQLGFEAVVYLAPATVPDAVKEEPAILAQQGIEFVHVPIPFGTPTEAHFEAVSQALQRLQGKNVLVHCQVNMRASTLVFLHRATKLREDPVTAWQDVTRVWVPDGAWKRLVTDVLARHGVNFAPF